jgi:hypothetical protein
MSRHHQAGRAFHAGVPYFVGVVERDEVNVCDPVAGGEFVEIPGDERAKQDRGSSRIR